MEYFPRQKPIILVSFLSICFLVGIVFSSYYIMSELDMFSPNLSFEDQDPGTLTTVEKVNLSFSYLEPPLLPICNSFLQATLVLQISLDSSINCPNPFAEAFF